MSGSIFLSGTHIEENHSAIDQALDQFRRADRLQESPVMQVGLNDAINLRNAALSHLPYRLPHGKYLLIRQAIVEVDSLAARLDQLGGAQHLQMLRGIRDRHACFLREQLHTVFALGQDFKEFETMAVRQSFANAGKLFIQKVFKRSFVLRVHLFNLIIHCNTDLFVAITLIFNRIIEYTRPVKISTGGMVYMAM